MEQVGFVVLAWFAIGCLVALVVGQIIRKGSYDRRSTATQDYSVPEHPVVVKRGDHRIVERGKTALRVEASK